MHDISIADAEAYCGMLDSDRQIWFKRDIIRLLNFVPHIP